ncbi:hypothetical protein B0H19DRAFT_1258765 [Mycena capillaripes]|nr:hypothetical protein B0H19DRAFT_1258765 [Mycena capillaripes]
MQRCYDDKDRHLQRLATYRKYRASHLSDRREKGRRQMAVLHATESEAARAARLEQHREAQRKYRERNREQIAHRVRRAAPKQNAAVGKATEPRPKTRQYWSDPELATDNED